MAVHVIHGVRIPDTSMAEMLLEAETQGFRLDPGTGTRHAEHTGFTVYPPDKAHGPIRVGCTEVNPRHVKNIRRSLVQAGYVPGGDMARRDKTQDAVDLDALNKSVKAEISEDYGDYLGLTQEVFAPMAPRQRADYMGEVSERLAQAAGLPGDAARLAAALYQAVALWQMTARQDGASQEDLDEALDMAHKAEERAARAEKAKEKAEAEASRLGGMLTEALARAEKAEADAAEMRKVIEPFRDFLAKTG